MKPRKPNMADVLALFLRLSPPEQQGVWQLMLQAMVLALPPNQQAGFLLGITDAASAAGSEILHEKALQALEDYTRRNDEETLRHIRSAAEQMARNMR